MSVWGCAKPLWTVGTCARCSMMVPEGRNVQGETGGGRGSKTKERNVAQRVVGEKRRGVAHCAQRDRVVSA